MDRPAEPCIDVARRRIFTPAIDFDGFELAATGKAVLDRVAELLERHPEIARVEIAAHDWDDPKRLVERTRRWAREVEKHLVARGVSPERLRPTPYGSDRPIDRNDTPEGRKRNRRIELVILPE